MKRLLATIIAAALAVSLAACGSDAQPAQTASEENPQTEESSQVASESAAPEEPTVSEPDTSAAEGPEGYPTYSGDPVELRFTWWGSDDRATRTNSVIEMFHELYPSITITGEPKPADSYWDTLNTQLTGGNAPDIMQMGGNYTDFTNYLLPINEFLNADGPMATIADPAGFDQSTFELYAVDDVYYGACNGKNMLALAYNKTMLESAGAPLPPSSWTWEEMIAYGESIKDLLPDGVWSFVDNSANQANYISYWFTQKDARIYTAEKKTYATEEVALSWLQLWEDMRAKEIIPDIETTAGYAETAVDNSILVAGKAAIGLLWANQLGSYQGAMTDELGLALLPVGGSPALANQGSQCLTINKDCASPEAAALFLNFFESYPEAGEILGTDRGLPSSTAILESLSASATGSDVVLFDYITAATASGQTIAADPNLPGDQEFVDNLKQVTQAMQFGNSAPEQAAKDIIALIERLAAM
ncbi:MAG: extracellular solute-binding protein [Clostridiales bacterium]|jgi:multiple sugar transport system substrate-binding protein|nr:extracellular solute-binding protein [Clostridiales bacterium]